MHAVHLLPGGRGTKGALMDYEAWRFWAGVAQMFFNIAIAIAVWSGKKRQAAKKYVDTLVCRIERAEKDVIGIKAEISSLPDQRRFDALSADINRLTSEIGELRGRLGGVNRVADLMNQFLINQGGKGS